MSHHKDATIKLFAGAFCIAAWSLPWSDPALFVPSWFRPIVDTFNLVIGIVSIGLALIEGVRGEA